MEVMREGNYQQMRIREIWDREKLGPRKLDKMPVVVYIGGCSGAGKTTLSKNILNAFGSYYEMNSTKWWHKYNGEKGVLLDEWRSDNMRANDFLRMLDVNRFTIEVKGSNTELQADKFVINSMKSSGVFWKGYPEEDSFQWARRLSCTITMVKKEKESWRINWHPEIDANVKNIIKKCINEFVSPGQGQAIKLDYGDEELFI